jgi:hypothetical protein
VIDFDLPAGSLRSVRLLLRPLALLLAVFWLPVTQHCGLEAVGVLVQSCEQAAGVHDCDGGAHAPDGCTLVESGSYKSNVDPVHVAAPLLLPLVVDVICFAGPDVKPVAEPVIEAAAVERPRNWVPTWHFVQRAALSPRAPSLVVA